jgi:hypothetical protein
MHLENHQYGSRSLKLNDTGTDVQDLQVKIVSFASKQSPITCDGNFSIETQKALENFCKLFSLKSQSIADERIYTTIENWIKQESDFLRV